MEYTITKTSWSGQKQQQEQQQPRRAKKETKKKETKTNASFGVFLNEVPYVGHEEKAETLNFYV